MYLFLSPNGRIGRLTWWLAGLVPTILACIFVLPVIFFYVAIMFGAAFFPHTQPPVSPFGPVMIMFFWVVLPMCMWSNFCLTVKRFHDRNKSAWWALISFAPAVGPLWLLIELGFLSGTPGGNAYGPDPNGGSGWSSKIDAEIAATWQEKHESYQYDEAPVAAQKVAPAPKPARTAVPSGFGRRGLQT